jgi:hypothetical protein
MAIPMQTLLFRQDLDAAQCCAPGCDGAHPMLGILVPCHHGVGIEATYDRRTGEVSFGCHVCKRLLCKIAVAEKPPVPVRLH